MIYGGYKKTGSKMCADPNIGYALAHRMRRKTLNLFFEKVGHPFPGLPHLDVGWGKDHARISMPWEFVVSNVDLDTQKYDFSDGYFGTVTSFEVLEHLYNPLFHLQEIRRVLHTYGRFYCVTPNDHSLIYKAEHLLSRKYGPHFHQFSEFDLRQIIARAGLGIVSLEKFNRGGSGTLARISRNLIFIVCEKT